MTRRKAVLLLSYSKDPGRATIQFSVFFSQQFGASLTDSAGIRKLSAMNPSKVTVSLLFLTISLLLLSGCEGMLPSETNPAVPNPETGIKPSPFDSGVRIVSAQATPLFDDFGNFPKKGAVNVHFNGTASRPVYVDVSAQPPGRPFYTDVGMATLHPGQRDVQVPIKVDIREPAQIPLKVTTRPNSGREFMTTTHYSGNR